MERLLVAEVAEERRSRHVQRLPNVLELRAGEATACE